MDTKKNNRKRTLPGSASLRSTKTMLMIMVCVLGLGRYAGANPLVELCAHAIVTGPDVLLKDIVKNPSALPSGWGERILMPSPKPGERSEYSLVSIAFTLQQYPDMQEALLRGQKTLHVQRKGADLAREKIIHALEQFVAEDERWENIETRLQCEPIKENGHLPHGDLEIKVKNYTPQREANRYLFNIVAAVNGTAEQTLPVYAKVIPLQEIWASKGALRQGHSISAADLITRFVDADSSEAYIPAGEPIEGLELTQTIRENEPLKRRGIAQPLCVQRGDELHVTAKSGALAVTLRAQALGAGRMGDYILCLNEQSKRRLRVKLIGEKQAVIDF